MKTKIGTITMLFLVGFDAAALSTQPELNAPSGSLRISPGVKLALIGPQNQALEVVGRDEPIQLQAGAYRILRWTLERRDEQGELWRLRAKAFARDDSLQINAGQETVLPVGEPVQLILDQREEGRGYRFSCRLQGQMGERVEISKGSRGRAIAPQLLIANADASYQKTIDFHFG